MNKITIASIAAVLATSTVAFAHGQGRGLSRFDRDGNGVVTRDEMRTTMSAKFDQMDTNKDGRLTLDEIQAFGAARAAERFASKDKNHDGVLDRTEVPRMPEKVFTKLDQNGDGKLSADELAAAHGHKGQHGAQHFAKSDTNGDGAISRDEFLAGVDRRFARIDTNGDGVVTQDEANAHHHGHGKGGQAPKSGQ